MSKGFVRLNMSLRDASKRKELMKEAAKKPDNAPCFYPSCPYSAIGSHVLQENGVLDQIADGGEIMEYARLAFFNPARFERAGMGNTNRLRFYGFCKSGHDHDKEVFSIIEKESCEYITYEEQLLSSYRGLCNGLYQKQVFDKYHNLVMRDKSISQQGKSDTRYEMANNMHGIKELQYFKNKMEGELFFAHPVRNFIFYKYELPKLDIAACHMFASAFRTNVSYEEAINLDINSADYFPVSELFFINLIPRRNKLIVIIGHRNDIAGILEGLRIDALGRLHEEQVIKLVSDILVRRIDTWALSIDLYKRLVFQDKIEQYLKFRSDYLPEPKKRSFFRPYNRYDNLIMPRDVAQFFRVRNRWELWRFMIPFNLFDSVI